MPYIPPSDNQTIGVEAILLTIFLFLLLVVLGILSLILMRVRA
jgi:hypothetical protein